MFLQIDPMSRDPVYLQVMNQIRQKIATNQLKPGDKLPTVRDLATELVVNPNTIQKAYSELSTEGHLYSRKGKGIFVAEVRSTLNEEEKQRRLMLVLDAFITEALLLGFSKEEVLQFLEDRLKTYEKEEGKDE